MSQTRTRRGLIRMMVVLPAVPFISIVGCGGGDPDQRKSGTLVVPLDSVEKAGEAAGKAEDAKKKK